ncbi:hypothetical protein BR93DRAFT_774738 [Coniochaeta sp. PMI_546]|nr:hypothetical protein BR93DRAFT_774738 [Coniochaeta sp. PMI_546]
MAAAELARYAGLGQNPTRWQINQRAYRDLRPWGGFGPMPMPSLPSAELTRYEGIWTTCTPLQVVERTRRDLRSWGGFGPLPAATGISTAPVLELPYPELDQSDKRRRALLIPSDYKHRCPVCGKECSDAEDLGAHYLVSHRQDWHHFQKPCVQDACARNQPMPIEDFREHYEREHGVYVCLVCGGLESKSNETQLADHKGLRGLAWIFESILIPSCSMRLQRRSCRFCRSRITRELWKQIACPGAGCRTNVCRHNGTIGTI